MKLKKLFTTTLLTLCACILAGALFLFITMRFVTYSAESCEESTEELKNPYIGWYQIYKYDLSDPDSCGLKEIEEMERRSGLALLELNLQGYAGSSISEQGLALLEQLLKTWQSTGRQLIVRFLYDWDGSALDKEPDNLDIILEHMTQTSGIINRYSDCVYILQGLFIGSWGELHGSRYSNTEDMLTLFEHLSSVTDPSIFLAVRTPEQWRALTGFSEPITGDAAFGNSPAARLSLFNDGMLGSATDLNTYADDSETAPASLYGMRSRKEEIAFQNLLCSYVPNGGEVVMDNPYNDFSNAVRDLADTHVSYLNDTYDEAVLSKWKNDVYTGDGSYNGMNGLDYISRHLGYRYVLRASDCSAILPWEKTGVLSVTLENIGFSGSYRPFELCLILENTANGKSSAVPFTADLRSLAPGTTLRLEAPADIRDYTAGTYDIYLKITDPVSQEQILLANKMTSGENGYLIGTMTINIFPE